MDEEQDEFVLDERMSDETKRFVKSSLSKGEKSKSGSEINMLRQKKNLQKML
jgi:hypothetical protein